MSFPLRTPTRSNVTTTYPYPVDLPQTDNNGVRQTVQFLSVGHGRLAAFVPVAIDGEEVLQAEA